jgi:hypothetical protein
MSNSYLQFSQTLALKTDKQREWCRKELERLSEEEYDGGIPLVDFEYEFDADGLWLYCEENGNVATVADFVQSFFKKFDKKGIWYLEWSLSCGKPLPGEFGGGAVVVTADKKEWMSTGAWVAKTLGLIRSGRSKKGKK